MAKGRVVIDEARCKGCALCVAVCPPDVLLMAADRLTVQGYHPAEFIDPAGRCTGCGLCAVICPDVCFTVYRSVSARPASASRAAASNGGARTGHLT